MIRSALVPAYSGLSVLDANGVTWHAMSGYAKRNNYASNGLPGNVPGGTFVRSINQIVNPSFEGGSVTPWVASGGTVATTSSFSQMLKSGTAIAQMTANGTNIVPSLQMTNAVYRPVVTPGQWVALDAFLATETGYEVRVQIAWLDSSGASISFVASSWVVGSFYTGAQPQIIAQAPANTASISYFLQFRNPADTVSNMASGKRMWADTARIFIGATQEEVTYRLSRPYYDGSTANSDVTTAWTGTANLSTSQENVPNAPTGWTYFVGTGEQGLSLYRALPGPDGRNGMARREIWAPKTSGSTGWQYTENRAGVSGDTFTAQMVLNCPTTLTSKLRISFYNGSTLVNSIDSGNQTLTAGVQSLVTVSGAATGAFTNIRIWFYHTTGNTPGIGTYDAMRCMIEPGSVATEYFDGARAADANYVYQWAGSAFASASIAQP